MFKKYAEQFEPRVGRNPNFTVEYILKKGSHPVSLKARPVSQALMAKVDKEYDALEKDSIITQIDHSDWGLPAVILPKSDHRLCVCIDYKTTLNWQLEDSHYPLPTVDGVLHKLQKGKIFCILDIYKAYLHIPVTTESAKMQTLTTHRGIYQVNRL